MKWITSIILSFLCVGLVQVSFKMISESQVEIYLLFCYGTAFLVAGIHVFAKKIILSRNEILFGIILGLSSVLQSYFWIMALQGLEGVVVYPAVSIGAIVLVTIVCTGLLKEKLGMKGILGMMFGFVAIIMLTT